VVTGTWVILLTKFYRFLGVIEMEGKPSGNFPSIQLIILGFQMNKCLPTRSVGTCSDLTGVRIHIPLERPVVDDSGVWTGTEMRLDISSVASEVTANSYVCEC